MVKGKTPTAELIGKIVMYALLILMSNYVDSIYMDDFIFLEVGKRCIFFSNPVDTSILTVGGIIRKFGIEYHLLPVSGIDQKLRYVLQSFS